MVEIQPKVSVIVPVYNVENYLEECLNSLVNQTLKEIEVIMVNDGSTDSSGQIMDRYAAKYENFKAIHKENKGLSHARNVGVPLAQGEYIAFLDSDDYVTKNAYRLMYETAKKTGSDLVIGNVKRFNSQTTFASGLHRNVFKETILQTHITNNQELLYDTTAWNKLFKRTFWDKYQFKFPKGILYEDLPVTIPAHFLSSSTDVLEDVVYYWRARDTGDKSITQQRNELKNFQDRMTVLKMVDDFFAKQHITGELVERKMYKDLSLDILLYLNELDRVDEEFIGIFFKEVQDYLKKVPDHILKQLNAIDRLKYYFVKEGDKEKLLRVLHFEKNEMKKTKIIKQGSNYFGDYPYRNELPESLFLMNDELKAVRKVESMKWKGNKLFIKGYNYIQQLDMKNESDVHLTAYLLHPKTSGKVPIPVQLVKRPDITLDKGIKISEKNPLKRLYNYDWSGFELAIDFDDKQISQLGEGRLELWFQMKVDSIERGFKAGGPIKGKKTRPSYHTKTGKKIYPHYNKAWDLVIESEKMTSLVHEVIIEDNKNIVIRGQTIYPLDKGNLCLVDFSKGFVKYVPISPTSIEKRKINLEGNDFEANVPIEALYGEENKWIGYLQVGDNRMPLTMLQQNQEKRAPIQFSEVHASSTKEGNLQISFHSVSPYLDKILFRGGKLKLELKIYESFFDRFEKVEEMKIYFQHVETGKVHELAFKLSKKGEYSCFTGQIPVLNDQKLAIFDPGIWRLYLETKGIVDGKEQVVRKRVRLNEGKKAFEQTVHSGIRLVPYRTKENNISIRSSLEWNRMEKGEKNQEILQKVLYPLFRLLPLKRKTVVFEAYWGKSYSCNPRAIYEQMVKNQMDYEYIWFFLNENTPIHGPGKQIRIRSWKYYYYLARAKYFVNNVNFPDFYKKRKRAVEVQTMHGTPLKTMGIDVPGEVDTEEKLNRFLRRCSRWDYLITPSKYVSELSRRCFVYKKEILEVGYPRNDKLFYDNNDERIRQLKERIGIPLNKKVILYAPTWREKKTFKLQLDLEEMREHLEDEYVVLLRFHYFVSRSLDISPFKGFAYNLSAYEDIQDLYLIADLLITDYSSVMFDYAILNRPILFYTYDLEWYRDELRGMYVDIEKEAPGPLVKTTDDLIIAIQNLNNYWDEYGDKMKSFRSKFCEFDDGHASERVIEKVFK